MRHERPQFPSEVGYEIARSIRNARAGTYDPNGNLASIRYPDGRLVQYTYDWRNQLVKADDGNGGLVEFTYDALGRRVEKKVTGISSPPVVSRYIWSCEVDPKLSFWSPRSVS